MLKIQPPHRMQPAHAIRKERLAVEFHDRVADLKTSLVCLRIDSDTHYLVTRRT